MKSNLCPVLLCAFMAVNVIASDGGGGGVWTNHCDSGSCVSIYDCPPLLNMLKTKFLTQSIVSRLRQAQCSAPTGQHQKSTYVCCEKTPPSSHPAVPRNIFKDHRPDQISGPSMGLGDEIPTGHDCGVESTTRKIIGGSGVELDEFPWMAILEYERHDGSWTLECGGFLINKRYIVTAAHCVHGKQVSDVGRLINVRLGEYNTETTEDCVQLDNARDCADPVKNYGVEEIIVHEDYRPIENSFLQRENDIALLRLSGNVRYSEFVAPICLPSPTFPGTSSNRMLVVAGWGRTLVSKRSSIKLKVNVPTYEFETCRQMYSTRNINLVDSQMCAGGNFAQDSCNGDSGGPLMSRENGAWIAEGIVSFGLGCGVERPAVYTKVHSFLPWIRSKLRP